MTSDDTRIRYILMLALPAIYTAILVFFAVEWLCYGHTDLKDIVVGGFTFLGGATAAVIGHYVGVQTAVGGLQAGTMLRAEALRPVSTPNPVPQMPPRPPTP